MNRRQMLKTMAAGLPILATAATAAAQRPRQADPNVQLDLNTAPPEKLMTLPGVDMIMAKKIMAGRPYKAKQDLLAKKILTQQEFNAIQARITVAGAAPTPPAKKK